MVCTTWVIIQSVSIGYLAEPSTAGTVLGGSIWYAAILEAKWLWSGKFTFHSHGIPEEYGAMGYFNVTDAPANAEDGKDIAITKSINMIDWQANLTKSIQKEDSRGNVTNISTNPHIGNNNDMAEMRNEMQHGQKQASSNNTNTNQVLIVNNAPRSEINRTHQIRLV